MVLLPLTLSGQVGSEQVCKQYRSSEVDLKFDPNSELQPTHCQVLGQDFEFLGSEFQGLDSEFQDLDSEFQDLDSKF